MVPRYCSTHRLVLGRSSIAVSIALGSSLSSSHMRLTRSFLANTGKAPSKKGPELAGSWGNRYRVVPINSFLHFRLNPLSRAKHFRHIRGIVEMQAHLLP